MSYCQPYPEAKTKRRPDKQLNGRQSYWFPPKLALFCIKTIFINPFQISKKQGRIHGYRSRVRVGRGSDKKG